MISQFEKWKEYAPDIDREDLLSLSNNQIEQSFNKPLKFGTSGVRAKKGIGLSFINSHTISMLSLVYGEYLVKKNKSKTPSVFVGRDNRFSSLELYKEAIRTLSGLGIKVFVLKGFNESSNSIASYLIKNNAFDGGLVIGAGHNSENYNGIKFFDSEGFVLSRKNSLVLETELKKISNPFSIVKNEKNIHFVKPILVDQYINDVIKSKLNSSSSLRNKNIVFSAMNGTTVTPISLISAKIGIDLVIDEKSRRKNENSSLSYLYDAHENNVFKNTINLANRTKSNIAIALSPDGEKLSVGIKRKDLWTILNPHELAAVQTYYILSKLRKQKKLNSKMFVARTFLTSKSIDKICSLFNVSVKVIPPGSSSINMIKNKKKELVAFFNETGGTIIGKETNNPDAIQNFVSVVDMYTYYSKRNINIIDLLEDIYKKVGYYNSRDISKKIDSTFSFENLYSDITEGESKTYLGLEYVDVINHRNSDIPVNAITIKFRNGGTLIIKASDTETVVRYYIFTRSKLEVSAYHSMNEIRKNLNISLSKSKLKKKRGKKVDGKNIFKYSVLLLSTIGIIIFVIFRQFFSEISTAFSVIFSSSNLILFILSIFIMLIPVFIVAFYIYYYGKNWEIKSTIVESISASTLGWFASYISPMGILAYPMEIWYLKKRNHHGDEIISTISIILVIQSISNFIFILATSIYGTTLINLYGLNESTLTLLWIGSFVAFFIQLSFILAAISSKISNFVLYVNQRILIFANSVEKADNFTRSLEINIRSRKMNLQILYESKMKTFFMIALAIGYKIALSSQLYISALMVGVESEMSYIQWVTISANTVSANSFNPLPGSTGSTEIFQSSILNDIFKSNGNISDSTDTSNLVTLLNRSFTYYFPIFITSIFFIISIVFNKNNKGPLPDISETTVIESRQYAS